VFNGLKRGDVVRFADIDEIVDHHCLNIFPIIQHAIITCLYMNSNIALSILHV